MLHPQKCLLFAASNRCCGRIISFDGVHFGFPKLNGLLEGKKNLSGAHLQQFVRTMQLLKH